MKEKIDSQEEKYIICDSRSNNHGKTETLLRLIDYLLLCCKYNLIDEIKTLRKDRWCRIQLPDREIVVDTHGDPDKRHRELLEKATVTGAKVIFAACRTSGNSVKNVTQLAKKYNYKIIWFSNFFWEKNITDYNVHNIFRRQEAICLSEIAHML